MLCCPPLLWCDERCRIQCDILYYYEEFILLEKVLPPYNSRHTRFRTTDRQLRGQGRRQWQCAVAALHMLRLKFTFMLASDQQQIAVSVLR